MALLVLAVSLGRSDPNPYRYLGWDIDHVPFEADPDEGVPLNPYEGGLHKDAVLASQWGLVRAANGRMEEAVVAADWLVDEQLEDGSWRYGFRWTSNQRPTLEPGWASAMAQGQALSLFARVYDATGDRRYLDAMERAVDFLNVPLSEGGVRSDLHGDVWLCEYPTRPRCPHVLNGFIFTLIGLWDAALLVPDAGRMYFEGRGTLEEHLPRWHTPEGVAYDLMVEVNGQPWVNHKYDAEHRRLLGELDRHTETPAVSEALQDWY